MKEFNFSDSEEEGDHPFHIYGDDPKFRNKDELEKFLSSCKNEKRTNEASENMSFQSHLNIVKNCTSNKCEDILKISPVLLCFLVAWLNKYVIYSLYILEYAHGLRLSGGGLVARSKYG